MNAPQRLELTEPAPMSGAALEAPPQRPLTVVEHAIRSGATPEQLQSLLELQVRADNHQLEMMREKRRMDEEDRKAAALLAFRRDFAAFRGEGVVIPKNKLVDRGRAGSFMQAEFHTFAERLSPALSKHGFSFRHNQVFGSKPWTTDGVTNDVPWVYVTCYLEHKDGHSETLTLEGPPGDADANTPVQNMQVTASVLKRQSLAAITGTATGGEDDENLLKRRGPRDNGGGEGGDNKQASHLEALLQKGQTEALNGLVALNAWWGSLKPSERNSQLLQAEYPAMRRGAIASDKQGDKA